jgi:hypothetical protein
MKIVGLVSRFDPSSPGGCQGINMTNERVTNLKWNFPPDTRYD